jgi:hypothetical protein
MVTSCCHGNMNGNMSSDCGLKSLFYIRGNNGLCKKIVFQIQIAFSLKH